MPGLSATGRASHFRKSSSSVEWSSARVQGREREARVRATRADALSSEDRERAAEDALDNGPSSVLTSAERFAPRRDRSLPGGNGLSLNATTSLLAAGRPGAPADDYPKYKAPFVGGVTVNRQDSPGGQPCARPPT